MVTATELKRARKRLGETKADFAKRFGVARSTINYWETCGPPVKGSGRAIVERVLQELSEQRSAAAQ